MRRALMVLLLCGVAVGQTVVVGDVPNNIKVDSVTVSTTVAGKVHDKGGTVYNVQEYGILPDNTNHSTEFAALLATVNTAGGGTIFFPPSAAANKYRFDSCFTLPNDSGSPAPSQSPLHILGGGSFRNGPDGEGLHLGAGTTLDVRCSSGNGFIDSRGFGTLEVAHINFLNGGDATVTVPFIYSTNTVLNVHDNLFYGSASVSGLTANQDAIILGGDTGTAEGGDEHAPYQGYGTVITQNHFDRLRRGVYARRWNNNLVVTNNTWWWNNGGDANSGLIEIDGYGTAGGGSNIIGNIFEIGHTTYAIRLTSGMKSYIAGNGCYDYLAGTSPTAACVYIPSGNNGNIVMAGNGGGAAYPYVLDEDGRNSVMQAGSASGTVGTEFTTTKTGATTVRAASSGGASLKGEDSAGGVGVYGTTATGQGVYGGATGSGTGGYFTAAGTGPASYSKQTSTGPITSLVVPNGAELDEKYSTELVTLWTGGAANSTSSNLLWADTVVDVVMCRVTTTITGSGVTSYTVGDATTPARFCSAQTNLTAGSQAVCLNHTDGGVAAGAGMKQASTAKLYITLNATPSAGAIRCTVFYKKPWAPTS